MAKFQKFGKPVGRVTPTCEEAQHLERPLIRAVFLLWNFEISSEKMSSPNRESNFGWY